MRVHKIRGKFVTGNNLPAGGHSSFGAIHFEVRTRRAKVVELVQKYNDTEPVSNNNNTRVM